MTNTLKNGGIAIHWQILIAMAVGVVLGLVLDEDAILYGEVTFLSVFDFLGTFFVRCLSMIVIPLIIASIISGVMGVGSGGNLGRMGARTLIYYVLTSTLAILTGLVLVNLVQPGLVDGQPVRELLGLESSLDDATRGVTDTAKMGLTDILMRLVPANPIAAAAEGQVLPLVVFCLLFGVFASGITAERRQTLTQFFQGIFDVMMGVTQLVIRLAPFGVFGLIAKTMMTAGLDALGPLGWYFLTVVSALAIHFLITLPLFLRFVGRIRNPFRLHQAVAPALLTAFSSASSSATLPVTMDCIEKRAGVSNRVSSFVLPLGATVNMDGTALYECVAAMFIAQAYGVQLDFAAQFMVVFTALLASIGAAGIPAAGLVMLAVVLKAAGLPLEGVGIILAVDRLLDMARTATNVLSDSTCTVLVARASGEKPNLD